MQGLTKQELRQFRLQKLSHYQAEVKTLASTPCLQKEEAYYLWYCRDQITTLGQQLAQPKIDKLVRRFQAANNR